MWAGWGGWVGATNHDAYILSLVMEEYAAQELLGHANGSRLLYLCPAFELFWGNAKREQTADQTGLQSEAATFSQIHDWAEDCSTGKVGGGAECSHSYVTIFLPLIPIPSS